MGGWHGKKQSPQKCIASNQEQQVKPLPSPKPKDPRSNANFISRLLFCWVGGLLRHGCHDDLEHTDLFAHPSEADSEKLHRKFNKYWRQELKRRSKSKAPRLWIVIVKCFWWQLLVQGLLNILEATIVTGNALLVGYLARYFNLPCDQRDSSETRNAYIFAASLVTMTVITSILNANAFLMGELIGMMTRIMTATAIYNKVLTLSQMTIGRISAGNILNLVSNDVQRFDKGFIYLHYILISPIHLVVGVYIIHWQIGSAAFIVPAFILMIIFVQYLLARGFGKLRFKSAKLTDKRVRIMNEVITGIGVIKMYAWEHAFNRVVSAIRKHEVKLIACGGVIRLMCTAFSSTGFITVAAGVPFLAFVVTGGELTSQKVFTILPFMYFLGETNISYIVKCFFLVTEVSVALKRIQAVLLLEDIFPSLDEKDEIYDKSLIYTNENVLVENEVAFTQVSPCPCEIRKVSLNEDSTDMGSYASHSGDAVSKHFSVKVTELSASWTKKENEVVLKRISFTLDHSAPLLGIIGPVGSGKSTLLQCLLGELEAHDGHVVITGRVSYASQEPWMFSASMRENILFGLPYRRDWYKSVIEACALDKDIEALLNGDLTLVGERGVTLSGGQKARVNLARAVYRDADIYLLDDPLSAVDTGVGKHLFEQCLCGILKDKLVILVTHQVHFAMQADQLLALKDGEVKIYGSRTEIADGNIDVDQLLILIGNDENDKEKFTYKYEILDVENEVEDDLLHVSISFSPSSHSLYSEFETTWNEDDTRDSISPPAEKKVHGSVSMKTYLKFFLAGGNYFMLFVVLIFFVLGEAGIVVSDWWLSDWLSCSELQIVDRTRESSVSADNGSCVMEAGSNSSFPQTCLLSQNNRLSIYVTLIISTVLLNFARIVLFYLVCINASRVLHNRMFRNILRIPVLFFDTNPSGRILNRFAKDIGFLDDLLPISFFFYLLFLLRFIAVLIVASIVNPFILVIFPFVIVMFLILRCYFLRSARDIRRLEALGLPAALVARSPVYSHISTTLQGLSTIRAFGQEQVALQHIYTLNNEHTKAWYLFLITSRWFGLRLDFLSNSLLISFVAFTIPLISLSDIQFDPALLSLGLTYIIALTETFQYCVRLSAEVENIMISTERIMEYCCVKSEASLETRSPHQKPPESWPDKGELYMKNVALQYSPDLPLVLKNLNLSIRPSEKVGIVGRTGAGKSSLISVLYRLAEPEGHITIDGMEIKSIGLHDLRKKMSIIPQDPVLFSGSVRFNLDPFEEYSDLDLWEVLEQVQLKEAVKQMMYQLSGVVSEGGSNFSVGQRQLICLARALLRNNKILILDEATANVDHNTDEIIQLAIKEKFRESTVLTIAHRLNTIMDSDRILVMSNGRAKEFASPYELLQNCDSQLNEMVENTGPEAAQKLRKMAEVAWFKTREK